MSPKGEEKYRQIIHIPPAIYLFPCERQELEKIECNRIVYQGALERIFHFEKIDQTNINLPFFHLTMCLNSQATILGTFWWQESRKWDRGSVGNGLGIWGTLCKKFSSSMSLRCLIHLPYICHSSAHATLF